MLALSIIKELIVLLLGFSLVIVLAGAVACLLALIIGFVEWFIF